MRVSKSNLSLQTLKVVDDGGVGRYRSEVQKLRPYSVTTVPYSSAGPSRQMRRFVTLQRRCIRFRFANLKCTTEKGDLGDLHSHWLGNDQPERENMQR